MMLVMSSGIYLLLEHAEQMTIPSSFYLFQCNSKLTLNKNNNKTFMTRDRLGEGWGIKESIYSYLILPSMYTCIMCKCVITNSEILNQTHTVSKYLLQLYLLYT